MAQPNYRKPQYSCIDVEDIVPETPYTFTFNPNDQRQFWEDQYRFKNFMTQLKKDFYFLKEVCRIKGFVEISKGGRLHFHGCIRFKEVLDIFSFFLNKVHTLQRYGTYEIDTLQDSTKWNEYVAKQSRFYPKNVNYIDTEKLLKEDYDPPLSHFVKDLGKRTKRKKPTEVFVGDKPNYFQPEDDPNWKPTPPPEGLCLSDEV